MIFSTTRGEAGFGGVVPGRDIFGVREFKGLGRRVKGLFGNGDA